MNTMNPSSSSIILIGPIAPPPWGPAVRNRIMLDTLRSWGINIIPLNTLEWKKNPIRFFVSVTRNVIKSRQVILSVSQNGRLLLIPLLCILRWLVASRVVFIPAGGLLGQELRAFNPLIRATYLFMLKRFDLICAQRGELGQQLRDLGLKSVALLPNFKAAPELFDRNASRGTPRILYLSRIRALKGIETLFSALDRIHSKGIRVQADFYGIITPEYEQTFNEMLKSRCYANYCGVIPYDKVIPTIHGYDVMVFPSVCMTEGFPGVLADAALAKLPVVASDIPACLEIIEDGYNGLIFKRDNAQDLADKLEKIIVDGALRTNLSNNNAEAGKQYDVNVVLKSFVESLKELGWKFES